MAERYFLKFNAEQDKRPYALPEKLKDELLAMGGVQICSKNYEKGLNLPVIVIEMEKDKVDMVKSLEGVVSLYNNKQFNHF